ncbi:PP2C family protein-serine/threonine phosphatase [Synechocystis sp. LEGE 06083]|uniref:PP2C family protein-serine/threonine phosphatase n=1 Tax=Synechocystis sp. LEGE 06083 TaxID=915336 RepID=UPI001D15A5E3|nr:PP2C family protein-serine/threonine phosphatase [Synechocystis sp. LEGE 06083]
MEKVMEPVTVGQRMLKPAVGLINRLHYPQKFALISVCFLLPLGLAIFLLLSEIQGQIQFAQLEQQGLAYLGPLQQLQQTVLTEPLTPLESSHWQSPVEHLEQVQDRWGQKLHTATDYVALEEALSTRRNNKETNPEEILQAIAVLRTKVGDQSNLILDPDLDSYYLMEALLLKLPQLQTDVAQLGTIIASHSGSGLSPTEESQLLVIKAQLTQLRESLVKNLGVAFTHNDNQQLQPRVSNGLHGLANALETLDQSLTRVISGQTKLDDPGLSQQSQWSLLNSLHFWRTLSPELDQLLSERIQRFQQRQWLLSTFVLATLAIAAYLFWGFYASVMATIASLSSAAEKMVAGSQTKAVELQTQDEMAEVVHAFNTVADALCRLMEKLQDENLRLEAEIDITRQLQQMLMPSEQELAAVAGLEIAGFMESATEVGGDYYDVLQTNGQVRISIGDVTGHDLESSLVMIMAQTALRTLLEHGVTDPVKLLSAMNRTIYENTRRMGSSKNMTLSLLQYEAGLIRLSGQHEEVLIIRSNGETEQIDTFELGFPLGLEQDISAFVTEREISLNSGDLAVLYTDGITEAMNIKREFYGIERLQAVLSRHRHQTPAEIRHQAIADLKHFLGDQPQEDDVTLLILKQK